jgi:transcription termination factor NusB
MSNRTDRRAAERAARKLVYQQLRQQQATSSERASSTAPETEDVAHLFARAQAFFETTKEPAAEPVSEPATEPGPMAAPSSMRPRRQEPAPEPAPEPEPISEAQFAANRANAQLSTGPVTIEGKAHSSMNALKTGLTGKTILLPHENAAEYQRQLEASIESFKPATDEELRLVESQLNCVWRLDRIQHLETAILLKGHLEFAGKYEDRSPLERAHLIQAEAYLKYERQLRNLQIQEARLRRTLEKDRAEINRLQANRRREESTLAQVQVKSEKASAQSANGFEFSTHPSAPNAAYDKRTNAA